jgi:DNA (cytosine-5)-methyltransferase 1
MRVSQHTAVEVCAGAGGQALGLELAGFLHVSLVETDAAACVTLRTNRPGWRVAEGDVTSPATWDPSDYRGIGLLAGGVPCQPFSVGGRQLGADDERDLFAWTIELCGIIQPRAIMLENVAGLRHARFAAYRQHVLDRLAAFGYVADWRLVNASDYGVSQLRPRFILVAMRPEDMCYFTWPAPLAPPPSVGEVLLDLMSARGWPGAAAWAERAYEIAPTIVGGSKKHGGPDLGPTRAKDAWAELGVDGLGIADAAPAATAPVDLLPRLTNGMVALLQGWDDNDFRWKFPGCKTAVYRQIGNAFPPPVARAIGERIRAALDHRARAADSLAGAGASAAAP